MKRTLTSIAAASLVLGTMAPVAFAGTTSYSFVQRHVSVNGQNLSNPWGFVHGGTNYFPIYYLQTAIGSLIPGATATWDGKNLMINVPGFDATKLSGPTVPGTNGIYINGTLVQKFTRIVTNDHGSKIQTSFAPIYSLFGVLEQIGLKSNMGSDGTWSIAPSLAKLTIAGNTSIGIGASDTLSLTGTDSAGNAMTIDQSKVTWSATGGVLSSAGVFAATASGTYTVTATYMGMSTTATVVVYGSVAGFKVSPASANLVANNVSTDAVTVTAVDANGNAVTNYSGTATIALTAGAATLATGTAQNSDLSGNTLTLTNGVGTVVLAAGTVPGLQSTFTATSTNATDANGILLNANATITSVAQVATAVTLTPASTYLSANNNGSTGAANQDVVTVTVADQTGNPMLTGSYGVQVSLTGAATFADGTTGPDYVAFMGGGTAPTVTLYAVQGKTGTVSLSATSTGLTSGATTVNAVVGQNASKLAVAPTTTGVTSFTEGAGNSVSYTLSTTDVNGAPAAYDFTSGNIRAYVTNSSGQAATNILVNGQAVSTSGVQLTGSTVVISDTNAGADAGNYTLTFKDASSTLASPAAVTVSESAGTATQYVLSAGAPEVSVTHPTTTVSVQFEDAFTNKVAPTSPVTFKFTGSDLAGAGYGSATLNNVDVTTGVYAQTSATGAATVTFTAQPYAGANWQITATPQSPSTLTAQNTSIAVNNTVVATATAAVVDSSNGNSPTNAKAGDVLKYTFGANDSNGNAISTGDSFTVTYMTANFSGIGTTGLTAGTTSVTGQATLTGTLTALNAAFATAHVLTAGNVSLTVTDATVTSANGTATIYVAPGTQSTGTFDLFDANGNNVTLSGLTTTANAPVELWLKPVDSYGNPVVNGQSTWVTLSDPNGGTFSATQNGAPTKDIQVGTGAYGVAVWYINPASNTWTAGATGTSTTLKFSGVSAPLTATHNASYTVSGYVYDASNNGIGGQSVTVSVYGGATASTTTNGNGYFTVTLTPTVVGTGTVSITSGSLSNSTALTVN